MKPRLLTLFAFTCLVAALAPTAAMAADKPNVVLMLADNVGWGDIGAYGGGSPIGTATDLGDVEVCWEYRNIPPARLFKSQKSVEDA